MMGKSDFTKIIYENSLSSADDIKDFILEGKAEVSFENKRLKLMSVLDASMGQKANYVLWCNEDFPADVMIEWDFYPLNELGLCMMFFAAKGLKGEDIFDKALERRNGLYHQYTNGQINAFHISYFRTNFRTSSQEPALRTCNLRKSKGFYMAAQGGDPIPELPYCQPPYSMRIIKEDNIVKFEINDVLIFTYIDDGITYGKILNGGKIGFRQMAPMVAEYSNLRVYTKQK